MGIVTKVVRGHEYLYQWHYDDGRKKEVYCGSVSDDQSMKKALGLELRFLKKDRARLDRTIRGMESKVKRLGGSRGVRN